MYSCYGKNLNRYVQSNIQFTGITGHKIQMKIQILMNMVILTENVVFFIFSEFEQLTLCAFTRHIIKHQYYGVLIHQLYVVLKIKYELLLNV